MSVSYCSCSRILFGCPTDIVKMSKAIFIISVFAALNMWHTLADDVICNCPRFRGRVCGTNNITYENLCRLTCAQGKDPDLRLAYRGDCEESPQPVYVVVVPPPFCTLIYNPVCASDGQSYLNTCSISVVSNKLKGLRRIHPGVCLQK